MSLFKKVATVFFACMFAFVLAGCGQPAQPEQPSGDSGSPIETLEQGTKINLTGSETEIPSIEFTAEEGCSLVTMGTLESGDIEVPISRNGEWFTTDYLYEGSGLSVLFLEPATYEVSFTVNEPATGTVYVLTLPTEVTDQLDFENSDVETLIQQILETIG